MKRTLILLLVLLSISGCSYRPVAEPTPEPTVVPMATPAPSPTPEPSPTPTPEPSYTLGFARLDCGVLWTRLERGETVSVVGESDEYYALTSEGGNVLVEKRFIRLAAEPTPDEWTGYAQAAAAIYPSPYLEGDALLTLALNVPITVVDSMGDILFVRSGETEGYMEASQVSLYPIAQYYGGGSGGGGGGQDGGEIVLGFVPTKVPAVILLSSGEPEYRPLETTGIVLADDVETYLALVERGDPLRVTQQNETDCQIWIGEQFGVLPRWMIRMETEETYEEWDGFAQSNVLCYASHRLRGEHEALGLNAAVRVLDDFGSFYLIQVGEKLGFVTVEQVKKEQVVYYGGGSGSSGGSEWTAPVL